MSGETITVLLPSRGRAAQLQENLVHLIGTLKSHNAVVVVILDRDDKSLSGYYVLVGQDIPVNIIYTEKNFTTAVEKYNLGYWASTGDWFVSGADDLVWHSGWLEAALATSNDGFVGFNDGHFEQTGFATHGMVRREVIERCMAGYFALPWYKSWYGDFEYRARLARGGVRYVVAMDALVEHRHPAWGNALMDETYRLGYQFHGEDFAMYGRRSTLGFPDEFPMKG